MQFRAKKHRRNRTQLDPARKPEGTPANATLTFAGSLLTMDFDNRVQLNAATLPIKIGTLSVLSVSQPTPTRIQVLLSETVVSGMPYEIPARMMEVRTPTGGYVVPQLGVL